MLLAFPPKLRSNDQINIEVGHLMFNAVVVLPDTWARKYKDLARCLRSIELGDIQITAVGRLPLFDGHNVTGRGGVGRTCRCNVVDSSARWCVCE